MSTLATIQSNYIPWKGYFDLIDKADVFVFLDNVQYTKNSWRNRNKIKTPLGAKWLTIPVSLTHHDMISRDVRVADPNWAEAHWNKIELNYQSAPFFNEYKEVIKNAYDEMKDLEFLCDINHHFIRFFCNILNIETPLMPVSHYTLEGDRNERLVSLCQQNECDTYLSGPAAQVYIDEALFNTHGIKVEYMNYGPYPEYEQLYPPFTHEVSILDLLLHTGYNAKKHMESL